MNIIKKAFKFLSFLFTVVPQRIAEGYIPMHPKTIPIYIKKAVYLFKTNYMREQTNIASTKRVLFKKDSDVDVEKPLPELPKRIKALFVTHNLNYEGASLNLFKIAKGLDKGVYDITVVSPYEGPLKDWYEDEGINVLFYNSFAMPYSTKVFHRKIDELAGWATKEGFDLIVCNTLRSFWGVHLAGLIKKPVVWCIRESVDCREYFTYHLPVKLAGLAMECFKVPCNIVFASWATQEMYKDLNDHNAFRVIYNGLEVEEIEQFKKNKNNTKNDVRRRHNIPEELKVITNISKVHHKKGQHIFVEAGIMLLKEGKKGLRFLIVGAREDDYLDRLQKTIKKSGFEEAFSIVSETSDVFDYYRLSDMFVCSSFEESLPMVILEAMAFELPIVSTDVFGIPEEIDEGLDGLLVPPGKARLMAERIGYLLDNEDHARDLGLRAYKKVKDKFSLQKMIKAYDMVFRETIVW